MKKTPKQIILKQFKRSLSIQSFDYFMKYLSVFTIITLIVFSSCNENTLYDIDKGYDYFPIEVGKWMVYQADSTVWNKFRDTTYQVNFFVKEEIVGEYTDSEGRASIEIDRSYSNDAKTWKKRDTWSASTSDTQVERVEENARFIKLAFPLLVGKKWKGNSYLNESTDILKPADNWDWDYTVKSRSATYTNGNLSFNDVAEIEQHNSESLLQKTLSIEHYAKGVGLVSKELMLLKTDGENLNGMWPDKTKEGYIYRQRLIDHN